MARSRKTSPTTLYVIWTGAQYVADTSARALRDMFGSTVSVYRYTLSGPVELRRPKASK